MLAKHAIISVNIFLEIQRALLKLDFQVINIGIAHYLSAGHKPGGLRQRGF